MAHVRRTLYVRVRGAAWAGTGGDAVRYGAYLRMDGNTHARTNAAQGQSTLLYSAIRIVNNYIEILFVLLGRNPNRKSQEAGRMDAAYPPIQIQ